MGIDLIITPQAKDLGEFSVRRSLPDVQRKMVGPWIFFDHMGPATFSPGEGVNVRPHPHINLATVTYLFDGEIRHRDSLSSDQLIRPGDVNLMVAGRGITHSERERDEVKNSEHRLHGLQLWHALPADDEEIEPAFYHYPASEIPAVDVAGVPVRVMMGAAFGVESPVKTFAETLYFEAKLVAGQQLKVPPVEECGIYVVSGSIQCDQQRVECYSMAILESNQGAVLAADQDATVAVIGGERLGERHLYWNFVSSRAERIEQAKADWREGRFATVPGDELEFIPLPGE